MDKSCANHPESMALATCKACDKSICLMCVVDEKEGTFCSSDCHTAFASGQEVPKFVAAAAPAAAAAPMSGSKKIESIFDDEPAAPAPVEEAAPPPSTDDPMPIVAEGTKWRAIGAQCQNHTDTPAVANCDRCSKPVCALCLLEAAQGTFCSADCMSAVAKQPAAQPAAAERAALQGKAPPAVYRISKKSPRGANKGVVVAASILFVLVAVAGGYYGWNGFAFHPDPEPGTTTPDPVVDPVVETPSNPVVEPPKDPIVRPPDPPPKNPNVDPNPPVSSYVPRPRVKVVKPKAVQSRAINPWGDTELGAWYRIRTQRGNQVSYTDTGLKEKGKDFYVLVTQSSSNGQDGAASETRVSIPTMYLRGEESFTYESQTFLCEIRTPSADETSTAPKFWTLLEGKNQGAVIKSETPEGNFTAARVWEHTLKVKNSTLECLVVEGPVQNRYTKMWFCGTVPLGVIRKESDQESSALIDLGSDWSKRPAFPK